MAVKKKEKDGVLLLLLELFHRSGGGEFRASGREFLCPRRQRNQNAAWGCRPKSPLASYYKYVQISSAQY